MDWLPIARKIRIVSVAVSLVLFWQTLLIIDALPAHGRLLYGIFLSTPTVAILLGWLFLRYEARGDHPSDVIRRVRIDTVGCVLWMIVLLAFILFDHSVKSWGKMHS